MDKKPSPTRVAAFASAFIGSLAETTGDYTMGAQQQLLLLSLYVHGELNQMDLPKFTGVERSSNSRNIARLGPGQMITKSGATSKVFQPGLGLVENNPDMMDKRVNLVRLTAKGRAVIESVAHKVAANLPE